MSNPYPAQQYPGGYQPPAETPAPPAQPAKIKKSRKWPWVLGILVAFGLGAAVGGSGGSTPAVAPAASGSTTTTVTAVAPAPAPVTVTAQAAAPVAPPAPAGPATSFGDGTFKVGTDIAAGSYKTSGPRDSAMPLCYWARLKDDSGSNIIANDNSQGPTRFTTKVGEYVQIAGCDFVKS
jgi:hypothetical protein